MINIKMERANGKTTLRISDGHEEVVIKGNGGSLTFDFEASSQSAQAQITATIKDETVAEAAAGLVEAVEAAVEGAVVAEKTAVSDDHPKAGVDPEVAASISDDANDKYGPGAWHDLSAVERKKWGRKFSTQKHNAKKAEDEELFAKLSAMTPAEFWMSEQLVPA